MTWNFFIILYVFTSFLHKFWVTISKHCRVEKFKHCVGCSLKTLMYMGYGRNDILTKNFSRCYPPMDQAEVQLLLQLVYSENVKSENVTSENVTSSEVSHLKKRRKTLFYIWVIFVHLMCWIVLEYIFTSFFKYTHTFNCQKLSSTLTNRTYHNYISFFEVYANNRERIFSQAMYTNVPKSENNWEILSHNIVIL